MKEQNADNKSKVTVKVPRRLTAILDKVQERSQFTSPAKVASACVEDEIFGIKTDLNKIKYVIYVVEAIPLYEPINVIDSDGSVVSMGKFKSNITVTIDDSKKAALTSASDYTGMSESDIIRSCIAIHLHKMVSNGDVDLTDKSTMIDDIEEMVYKVNERIGRQAFLSEKLLEYYFVRDKEETVKVLKEDPKQSRRLRGIYNESLKGSEIIKEFDRDIVDAIESVLDEVGE